MDHLNSQTLKKIILLALLPLSISFNASAGGGWTKKKGKGYYKLMQYWIIADEHFDNVGNIDPQTTFGIFSTALFAEYGITDRIDGLVYFPFYTRSLINSRISGTTGQTLTEGDVLAGLGDLDLTLKYRLTKDGARFPVSVSVLFGIPTGIPVGGRQDNLQTGDGEFNQSLRLDVSRSIGLIPGVPLYASAYVRLNNRTNNFSDDWFAGLELGAAFFSQKLWLIGRLDNQDSFKNGSGSFNPGAEGSTTIFASNSEFTSFTTELAYYVTKGWGVSVAYGNAFRGELILADPAYTVGMFFDMR